MLRMALVALALTLAVSGAEARRESSRMHNPSDNPTNAPTPEEFNHQEWLRRKAHNVCATLFECASGGQPGYTHLPYVRGYVVEQPRGYVEEYPSRRHPRHRPYR